MFYVGVDLGQRADFTAIAVLERHDYYRHHLEVRWLERLALGTPYTVAARRVEAVAAKLGGRCEVAVDATGLGAPVVDLLRESRMPCRELAPVVITGGERGHQNGGRWYVPKRDLIGQVQLLLEREELWIAQKLKETRALVRELVQMRMKGKQETHADLVLAVALACWLDGRPTVGLRGDRLPGI